MRATVQLKRARDSASALVAQIVQSLPALERPYAAVSFACSRVPGIHGVFREATRQMARRMRDSGRHVRPVHIGGVMLNFDVTDFTVQGWYFSRVTYEPGATSVVLRLEPGQVFVDIGANSGYFSILAAARAGREGRVFSFEPNPVVRRRLERHVDANGFRDRVRVSELAISDRDADDVSLFLSCRSENSGLSSLMPSDRALANGDLSRDVKVSVRSSRFDSWMRDAALSRIDLVKIDVEGTELAVLHGMRRTLDHVRPQRIICETPPGSAAEQFLCARGYRAGILDSVAGGVPNLLFERIDA